MYTLKGFLVIQPLTNNIPNALSPIGELSTHSKTFSKEIGHYSNQAYPDVDLMAFHSVDEVGEGTKKEVPPSYQTPILTIGEWLYSNSVAGVFSDDVSAFTTAILTEFSGSITDLVVGDMVLGDSPGIYLPQYIQFKMIDAGVNDEDNFIRLWLSDHAFKTQYDEFEIDVVAPLDDLDDFFKTAVEVKALLDQMNDSERMFRIQTAIGEHPPTITRVDMFEWSNPIQPDITLSTPWAVIIYGPYGNNVDSIKSVLINHILDNSSHTREEWEEYLPDLFKSTEFIITPLWNNFSIPNETLVKGLYSPTIRHKDVLEIAKATSTRYTDEHVTEVLCTSVANYRSSAFLAVGGPDNRDGISILYDKFRDYVTLSTSSVEFGRMSLSTQEWAIKLSHMLELADTMTEFSDLPLGMTRLIRDGIMYLVSSHDEVQYLVVSRASYIDLFGDVSDEEPEEVILE